MRKKTRVSKKKTKAFIDALLDPPHGIARALGMWQEHAGVIGVASLVASSERPCVQLFGQAEAGNCKSAYTNLMIGLMLTDTADGWQLFTAMVPRLHDAGADLDLDLMTISSHRGSGMDVTGIKTTPFVVALFSGHVDALDALVRPAQNTFAPRLVRRPLLMPQVNPGSLHRCGKSD